MAIVPLAMVDQENNACILLKVPSVYSLAHIYIQSNKNYLIEQSDGSYTYHRGCPEDYDLNVNFGSDGCYELNGVRWSNTKGPFAKLCFTSRRKSMFVDVKMRICAMLMSLAQLTVNLQLWAQHQHRLWQQHKLCLQQLQETVRCLADKKYCMNCFKNILSAPSSVQCQVCGQDGLCNGFEDNGKAEDCPADHACFYVTESKPFLAKVWLSILCQK